MLYFFCSRNTEMTHKEVSILNKFLGQKNTLTYNQQIIAKSYLLNLIEANNQDNCFIDLYYGPKNKHINNVIFNKKKHSVFIEPSGMFPVFFIEITPLKCKIKILGNTIEKELHPILKTILFDKNKRTLYKQIDENFEILYYKKEEGLIVFYVIGTENIIYVYFEGDKILEIRVLNNSDDKNPKLIIWKLDKEMT